MSFVEDSKKFIIVFLVAGVVGLIATFIRGDFTLFDNVIDASLDEKRINFMRVFLSIYEFFWLITIAIGFYYLSKTAGTKMDEKKEHSVEKFESKFMKIMIVILVITAIATLIGPIIFGNGLPQYNTDLKATQTVVEVQAHQYQFQFRLKGEANFSNTITLKKGVDYMFQLTTIDTTHGFGVYDPGNVFVVQAQIVPGYTTNLAWSFNEAGTWTIRCMEYCGVGHHVMEAEITVEA